MTAPEAMAVVREERGRLEIDDELRVASTERALVPFLADRTRPGKIEHRVAWIVTLSSDWGFAEVHVEDATGRILDVVRSA
jgi:hypothetical protein